MGTIAGALSTYSPNFFRSGTSLFTDQGWWTLSYPKLTPNAIFQISAKVGFNQMFKTLFVYFRYKTNDRKAKNKRWKQKRKRY